MEKYGRKERKKKHKHSLSCGANECGFVCVRPLIKQWKHEFFSHTLKSIGNLVYENDDVGMVMQRLNLLCTRRPIDDFAICNSIV